MEEHVKNCTHFITQYDEFNDLSHGYSSNPRYYSTRSGLTKSFDNYLLLVLDYAAFYFPKVWFYKFGFIKTILCDETEFSKELKCVDGYYILDLTEDFHKTVKLENINYEFFTSDIYKLCLANVSIAASYEVKNMKPLKPFLEFMCYEFSDVNGPTGYTGPTGTGTYGML
jgi:hypothetical protein